MDVRTRVTKNDFIEKKRKWKKWRIFHLICNWTWWAAAWKLLGFHLISNLRWFKKNGFCNRSFMKQSQKWSEKKTTTFNHILHHCCLEEKKRKKNGSNLLISNNNNKANSFSFRLSFVEPLTFTIFRIRRCADEAKMKDHHHISISI